MPTFPNLHVVNTPVELREEQQVPGLLRRNQPARRGDAPLRTARRSGVPTVPAPEQRLTANEAVAKIRAFYGELLEALVR